MKMMMKVSITVDEQVYNNYKKYCQENGLKVSTKINKYMKDIRLNDFSLQSHETTIFEIGRKIDELQFKIKELEEYTNIYKHLQSLRMQ